MAVPDDSAVARHLDAEGYFVRAKAGDQRAASLFARLCAFRLNPSGNPSSWGWLRKGGGQNVDGWAEDAIVFGNDPNDLHNVVDTVVGAGAPGASLPPRWTAVPRRASDTWAAPRALTEAELAYLRDGAVATHQTALGVSLFWAHAGTAKYQDQLRRNCDYAVTKIGATFARWFLTVGGDLFSGADPWEFAGAFFYHPRHEEIAHETLTVLRSFGLKSHLVLVGSRAQADTDNQRNAIVDRAARVIHGHEAEFMCVEMHNEYQVNGSFSHDCRNMARRLKGQVPAGFPIALSSPDSLMGGHASSTTVLAEIEKMYGGDSGANVLTEHNTRPEPVWNPETLRQIGVTLPILSGEPRGPGASAGGDVSDPAVLGADFGASIRGRAIGHVYHPLPGIWGGHCHPQWPDQNRWATFADVPNADAIAAMFKGMAGGGSAPVPGPTPIPPGGDDVAPYPSEQDYLRPLSVRIAETYREAGREDIAQLIALDPLVFAWPARTIYDVAAGLTTTASEEKHIAELRQALGLP